MTSTLRVVCIALLACGAVALGGCGRTNAPAVQFHSRDISFLPPLEYRLTDGTGSIATAAGVHGEVTLLYFGYTHCPDVCPTTLAYLTQVLKRLGPQADAVRVLFVSVDPRRDTPGVLKQYTGYFAPQLLGLSGTDEQLTALTKRYRVAYRRDVPDANGNYAVYHSSAIFVFDPQGRARLLASDSEPGDALAQDLRALMR